MAIFGVQLALSMIAASIISKLGGYYSFGRWLLCGTGLIRYLHPTDDELRQLANVPKNSTKKKKDMKSPDVFHVPRDLDLRLESVKVSAVEVTYLRFYPEYHWVVDYTLYSAVVYVLTEIYYAIAGNYSANETNLAVFWCLVGLGLSLRVLISTTAIYFQGDEVISERALCMVMGVTYLLASMIILIVDEESLEVGVDPAYASFQKAANDFLAKQGGSSVGPASKLIVKFFIAVCCGFMGSLFIFPGIRVAKMFRDSLRYSEGRPLLKLLYTVSFVLPIPLLMLWIKPLGRHFCTQVPLAATGEPLMDSATFDSLRLYLVVSLVMLRISCMPFFLQSFLNVAQDRLLDQRNKSGRILNTDLQKQVGAIFYYLCIVALQYITPCLILLQCCFLYKTLGGGTWTGDRWPWPVAAPSALPLASFNGTISNSTSSSIIPDNLQIALVSLKLVFNETVFSGIFGFATWWTLFMLVTSSIIGTIYTTYLVA